MWLPYEANGSNLLGLNGPTILVDIGFDYAIVVRGLLHSVCADCGERGTTADQTCHNTRVLIDARAQAVAERDRLQRLTPAG